MANGPTIPDGRNQIRVPKVFVNEIRILLGDEPESNEVVEGTEFSDPMLARHLVATLQDFNTTPPLLQPLLQLVALGSDSYYLGQIRSCVIEAAAGRALKFGALRRAKNQIQFQAGSVSYDENANWQAMLAFSDRLLADWKTRVKELKVAINLSGGYAVANSDLMVATLESKGGFITISGGMI